MPFIHIILKTAVLLWICFVPVISSAQTEPVSPLIYFDNGYYTIDRFDGDSVVLKVQLQLSDHPDFKDMPANQPEVRLEYFSVQDSARFYDLYEERQYIYKAYVDFKVSFDRITTLAHTPKIIITESYVRRLGSEGYSFEMDRSPVFSSKLEIVNCHLDTLFWTNIDFQDSVYCDDLVSRHCFISGCSFAQHVLIADVNTAHIPLPINFSYEIFDSKFLSDLTLYRKSRHANMSCARTNVLGRAIIDNWAYDYDIPDIDTTAHFVLWNCTLEQLIIKKEFRGLSFSKVRVQSELSIAEAEMTSPLYGIESGIKQLFIPEGVTLMLTPDQDLGETGIGLDALQHATLQYVQTAFLFSDDDNFYASVQQNIDRLKQYVSEYKTANKDQKDDVLNRLEYRAEHYRREFYERHLGENGNAWKLMVSNTLEFLVRNGYHGEWIFVSRALFLIVLFMFIYMLFFRRTIDAYVTKEEFFDPRAVPSPRLKKVPTAGLGEANFGDYVLSMTLSMWFSFVVFVNPKFPNKYFKFYRPLLYVIIIEWSIGLFMLFIFAFFIASRFPFIKALFGI